MTQIINDEDLAAIYPVRDTINVGKNHQQMFSHAPSPTTGIPDINDLRASVKEWDDNFSVPYPNTHFEETVIAGLPSTIYKSANTASVPTILLIHGADLFVKCLMFLNRY